MSNQFLTNYTEVTFLDKIKDNLRRCKSFAFSVSFIKKAGLVLLFKDIEAAVERGAQGRIITSTYQNFTDIESIKSFFALQCKHSNFECHLDYECFHDNNYSTLAANKSVEFFDDDLDVYESILKVISKITEVKCETFERDFSIQVLGDSKAFEKVRSKVVSLLYEYGDFPDKDMLLADLNIVKNPGHVYFKGKGKITVCGQEIDFSNMTGDMAISSELLKNVDGITVLGDVVVTIENLTTFNAFKCENSFAIYLGGYHNTSRRNFIKKVYAQNPDKQYLHFGDIDAGGFYILQHLRNKTGIGFVPYCMDAKTLKVNLKYTKKLTENDKKRLSALAETEFLETVEFMLQNNCKLEQEAMDLMEIGI